MIRKMLFLVVSILLFCNSAYAWNLSGLGYGAQGAMQADEQAAQLEALQQQNQIRAIQLRQMQQREQIYQQDRQRAQETEAAQQERRVFLQEQRSLQQKQQEDTEKYINTAIRAINSNVPRMVAKHVRFDGATFVNNRLVYEYAVLGLSNKNVTQEKLDKFNVVMKNQTCTSDIDKNFLSIGAIVTQSIKDSKNSPIYSFEYREKDCM